MARAATEIAAALRRQIHRQMYRLGQSSLPTEGVGPVINLWTREVNDIRDGVIADLDATPRLQVLAAGLLIIALLVSPILTVFLASLGILVWLIARVLDRDARQANEVGAARRFRAALPAPRRPGPAAHGSSLRRQRVSTASDSTSISKGSSDPMPRRIITGMPLNPSTGLLYGAGVAIALGLLGYNVIVNEQITIATMLVLLVSLAGLGVSDRRMAAAQEGDSQANRSARSIFEFLERRPELHQNVGAHFLNALKEQITFENVELESRSGRRLLEVDLDRDSRGLAHGHHGSR